MIIVWCCYAGNTVIDDLLGNGIGSACPSTYYVSIINIPYTSTNLTLMFFDSVHIDDCSSQIMSCGTLDSVMFMNGSQRFHSSGKTVQSIWENHTIFSSEANKTYTQTLIDKPRCTSIVPGEACQRVSCTRLITFDRCRSKQYSYDS